MRHRSMKYLPVTAYDLVRISFGMGLHSSWTLTSLLRIMEDYLLQDWVISCLSALDIYLSDVKIIVL